MIITEIYVPSVDRTYEFKLNEDAAAEVVIDEVCSVICQKEQCPIKGDKRALMLFSRDNGRLLLHDLSLYDNGVQSGDSLMLI